MFQHPSIWGFRYLFMILMMHSSFGFDAVSLRITFFWPCCCTPNRIWTIVKIQFFLPTPCSKVGEWKNSPSMIKWKTDMLAGCVFATIIRHSRCFFSTCSFSKYFSSEEFQSSVCWRSFVSRIPAHSMCLRWCDVYKCLRDIYTRFFQMDRWNMKMINIYNLYDYKLYIIFKMVISYHPTISTLRKSYSHLDSWESPDQNHWCIRVLSYLFPHCCERSW